MYNEMLKNRIEAGILLSERLKKYRNTNSVVLAIPRGGVPIGAIIAKNLQLQLDIVLSKKIGHPQNKEFAIGAVSMDAMIIDKYSEIPTAYIDEEIIRLRKLLQEKYKLYMHQRKPIDIKGKNIIIVDDGIATGNTLLVSIAMLRKKQPAKIIVAVPILPYEAIQTFEENTDELIYLIASKNFRAFGHFYEEFNPVEDTEVIQLLLNTNPNQ